MEVMRITLETGDTLFAAESEKACSSDGETTGRLFSKFSSCDGSRVMICPVSI
jgi:hypothetical protein